MISIVNLIILNRIIRTERGFEIYLKITYDLLNHYFTWQLHFQLSLKRILNMNKQLVMRILQKWQNLQRFHQPLRTFLSIDTMMLNIKQLMLRRFLILKMKHLLRFLNGMDYIYTDFPFLIYIFYYY